MTVGVGREPATSGGVPDHPPQRSLMTARELDSLAAELSESDQNKPSESEDSK